MMKNARLKTLSPPTLRQTHNKFRKSGRSGTNSLLSPSSILLYRVVCVYICVSVSVCVREEGGEKRHWSKAGTKWSLCFVHTESLHCILIQVIIISLVAAEEHYLFVVDMNLQQIHFHGHLKQHCTRCYVHCYSSKSETLVLQVTSHEYKNLKLQSFKMPFSEYD